MISPKVKLGRKRREIEKFKISCDRIGNLKKIIMFVKILKKIIMKKITLLLVAFTMSLVNAQEATISDAGIGLSENVQGPAPSRMVECTQGLDGFDINGAAGTNVTNGFVSAVDIIIPAGESFTLESVSNLNMLTFAGLTPISATVTYYEDGGEGFPSNSIIGFESGISITVNSSVTWVNPAADVHNLDFDLEDITFDGNDTEETKVWIGIQFESSDGSATFFEIRQDDINGGDGALVGEPLVQQNPDTGVWGYVDFGNGDGEETDSEGFYTLNGQCNLLGIDDNILSQISVYPNPASDILNINMPSNIEINKVSMFDALGRKALESNDNNLNISELARGIYILKIETSNGDLNKKIVIE